MEEEGIELADDFHDEYKTWENLNTRLVDKLEELLAGPVRELKKAVGDDRLGKMRSDHQRRNGWFLHARKRPGDLTDAEDAFLRLFSLPDDKLPTAGQPMSHDLYVAAQRLDRVVSRSFCKSVLSPSVEMM